MKWFKGWRTRDLFYVAFIVSILASSLLATTTLRNVFVKLGNNGTLLTGTVGNSGVVQQAGAVGTSAPVCTDAGANTSTVGCGFSKIQVKILTSTCSTGSAENKCTVSVTWDSAFPDTNYGITCSIVNPTGTATNPGILVYYQNKTTTGFSLVLQAGSNSAGGNNTSSGASCIGIHP